MALINWGIICPVTVDEETLPKLRDFGKWFTQKVHDYGIKHNQLYNFFDEPVCMIQLKGTEEEAAESLDETYESLSKEHPNISFVLHILPHKHSREFDKLKEITNRLALIGQGVLLDNALSKFGGADESAVFHNINQYIARRFAQIVDIKHDQRKIYIVVKHSALPVKERNAPSYHMEDIHSTVTTVLHSEQVIRMAQTQHEAKCFRQTAIVCGLPEHYTRYQVAEIFAPQPVASVLLTSRCCAFVDFFEPNGPHNAKSHFDEHVYVDKLSKMSYKISVCPIQSRYHRFVDNEKPNRRLSSSGRRPLNKKTNHDVSV
ncbi:hypothetical protein M3Y98_00494800 [Aphelenchoides besseyi]|nr:hypothetical protein M3Y98_00494800 [Aphelenchoides besseyi]